MKEFFISFFQKLKSIFQKKQPIASDPEMPSIQPVKKPRAQIDIPSNQVRDWKGIVWHHSASPDTITRNWDAIVRYHKSYRIDYRIVTKDVFERLHGQSGDHKLQLPWRDVGYHGGTELVDGKQVFQLGRLLCLTGAHAAVAGVSNRFNEECIGLCRIGNFERVAPSKEEWEFDLSVTRSFMDAFGFGSEQVLGHREVYDKLDIRRQKTCPGMMWDVYRFRGAL